jgi:hypothetical protein
MKSPGSVLIVVLGLLAILAIVGVTFVTMSSMDRSTASNFALQSQFMLAADGAVDYVCDHLIKDLWQFFPKPFKSADPLIPSDDPWMIGTPLLTDLKDIVDPHTSANVSFRTLIGAAATAKYCAYIRNEPWDAPGAFPPNAVPGSTGLPEDPWLATTLDMKTLKELAAAEANNTAYNQPLSTLGVLFAYSYGYYLGTADPAKVFPFPPAVPTFSPYGMYSGVNPCWWKDAKAGTGYDYTNRANNLGIPGGLPEIDRLINLTDPRRARHVDPYWPPSGVWIPELSFPFENGIIRVSVTVQDHNALLNANIHENRAGGRFTKVPISNATGRGYFVSDVALLRVTVQDQYVLGIDPYTLLKGIPDKKVAGRWAKDDQATEANYPTNASLMQTEIENPTGVTGTSGLLRDDRPFTLEEEFELRRYLGTSYRSRLEAMGGTNFEIDPATDSLVPNESKLAKRMALTTVGWTSEVRPDPWVAVDPGNTATAMYHQGSPGSGGTYSAHKADVNLDGADYIFQSLWNTRCFNHTDTAKLNQAKQFAANIIGFRDGRDENVSPLRAVGPRLTPSTKLLGTESVCAASRQPIIDKVILTSVTPNSDNTAKVYRFQVELLSPWEGNCVGDTQGLSYPPSCLLAFKNAGGGTVASKTMKTARMPNPVWAGRPLVVGIETYDDVDVTVLNSSTLTQTVDHIQLTAQYTPLWDPPAAQPAAITIVIDEMQAPDFADIETQKKKYRPVYIAYDPSDKLGDYRGINNDKKIGLNGGKENPVRVVYIGDWAPLEDSKPGAQVKTWGQPQGPDIPDTLPIRFPRSCDKNRNVKIPDGAEYRGLPPIATSTCTAAGNQEGTFKAIPRLGDLSQVIWWDGTGTFWPWTTRVSKKQVTRTSGLFPGVVSAPTINYLDPTKYSDPANFCIYYFANALCTGGSWSDGLDNDGDVAWDEFQPGGGLKLDTGEKGYGQLFGPELRVAGKINLNTATQDTLKALESTDTDPHSGVGVTGLWEAVKTARKTGRILTPGFLLDATKAGSFSIASGSDPTGTLSSLDDMRREAFARISNIVTIRSDTFSIYGTVQYVDAAGFARKRVLTPTTPLAPYVKRTRRFWALVDRSPTAAYSPAETTKFMHPRVMNFQWMD